MFPPDLIQAISQATRITVLTGAGVSAESGIPTFRDAQTGLWAKYQPEELATPQAFSQNPQRVWEWYAFRRQLIAQARPNPGHIALASLEQNVSDFTLVTQNIDGLHQAAGSRHVLEIHGSIWSARCFACAHPYTGDLNTPQPPTCAHCGGLVRPAVVWFGESLPGETYQQAMQAARRSQVFLLVGTSALVHPAASLPVWAIEHGAHTVEINPAATPLTRSMDYSLRGKSGEILPALVRACFPKIPQED
jgi:NAD-dependent deacetylase